MVSVVHAAYIQYDIEQEYHIHMQQHMLDDRRELKAIKSQNKKRKEVNFWL